MSAIIEAVDLRKTYRVGKIEVPALRSISFFVEKGEFVSVVGPSGSGKSTLFYLLGGLTPAGLFMTLLGIVSGLTGSVAIAGYGWTIVRSTRERPQAA